MLRNLPKLGGKSTNRVLDSEARCTALSRSTSTPWATLDGRANYIAKIQIQLNFKKSLQASPFLLPLVFSPIFKVDQTQLQFWKGGMASWNSIPLEITYEVLGWAAFISWSISFYPQVILNFRRKSVVGLNFDFVVLNLTKHSSYLIYNATLYFSSAVQKQYFEKYGLGQMIPVAANDVAFSIHAVLLTAITLYQIAIYERGNQKVSKISIGIVAAVWLGAAVCVFLALPSHSWLWLISIFNSIQVFMTVIKYIPQAVMNFLRKSTDGFSIGNILLDFSGGVANYAQMAVQSVDQGSWVNFYGNIGKTL